MKFVHLACAIGLLGAGYAGSALAQDAAPSSPAMNSEASESAAVGTGQSVYDTQGTKLGVVSGVKTDAKGEQQAVVDVGTRNIQIAAADLQARSGGGFTTTLSIDDIAKAPTAK